MPRVTIPSYLAAVFVSLAAAQSVITSPALASSITCDFTKGPCSDFETIMPSGLSYDKDGAVFGISTSDQGPIIGTKKHIFFGKVEVEAQSAPGVDVVSAVALLSRIGDGIDFEWDGSDTSHVQSNHFGKDNATTWRRGGLHQMSEPAARFYKYAIEWTKDFVKWSINGKVVRELTYQDARGGSDFPQTPMQIQIGTWMSTKASSQAWVSAGGAPRLTKGPFVAHFKSVTVVDYAGGNTPVKAAEAGVEQYTYKDEVGHISWDKINIVKTSSSQQLALENEDRRNQTGTSSVPTQLPTASSSHDAHATQSTAAAALSTTTHHHPAQGTKTSQPTSSLVATSRSSAAAPTQALLFSILTPLVCMLFSFI